MLKLFNRVLEQFSEKATQSNEIKIELAAAVLFYEIGRADFSVDEVELGQIREALAHTFQLTDAETEELMAEAVDRSKTSHDYHQFTKVVHAQFSHDEKCQLMKHLWRIALADGKIDPHEEHLLRKIADLIYISNADFLQAKHQVLNN